MCGICGIYNFNKEDCVSRDEIASMNSVLRHRGPDEEGLYAVKNIGMGASRLKIIDLNTGKQPVHNEDNSIWVVFNGEIYNYKDLREILEKKGHKFYTRSDTETIVHAYEEYGEDCVLRFDGMFAFAIWDARQDKLFIARDRLGIKPLFYSLNGKRLVFGSEIKAVIQSRNIDKEIDLEALHNFLSFSYIPAPLSIFRHIKKLLPGHMLSCRDGKVKTTQYWDLAFCEDSPKSYSYYLDNTRNLLIESVKKKLQSDVSVGVLLSGGIDSSIIAGIVTKFLKKPVKTFTVRFNEASYDEGKEAALVSDSLHTEHREYFLEADSVRILSQLIKYFDEPFADSSAIAMHYISGMAKEHVGVVLCGDGGDELFGGYDTYSAYEAARIYKTLPKFLRKNIIAKLVKSLPVSTKRISLDYKAKTFVEGAEFSYHKAHYMWKVIFNEEEKMKLYSDDLLSGMNLCDSFRVFEAYFDRFKEASLPNQFFAVDIKTFLPDDNLAKVDRMTMAHALEARVPFLDHNLVEFALKIPSSFKVKGLSTKILLRKAFSDILPSRILRGRKKGFTIPGPKWLKSQQHDFILDVLSQDHLKKTGFFNGGYVSKILDEHFDGKRDNNRAIFSLLSFVLWHDYYKNCRAA